MTRRVRLAVLALAPLALLFLTAAPAASGCGTRQVGQEGPARPAPAPARPPPATAAKPVAPAPAAEAEPPEPPPPRPAALAGDYECRFTRGERELPPAPCAIRAGAGGALAFEQAGGAVRLSGTVTQDDAGFRLSGEVTCAGGPCPRGSREIVFFSQGQTGYSAVLPLRSGLFLNIDLVRRE